MKSFVVFCIVSLLAGCATKVNLNMGESDYRVAVKGEGTTVEFVGKYESDSTLPSRLIKKDESISVHLKQAFIENFSERTEKFFASFGAGKVRGEIAIVARVFELGQGETLDFRNSATKKLGRLIYYSEDVRTGGHLLNESMLPVYGPITYKGNPIAIQLTVLELDIGESQQIKALLSTLANLGAKAYAPASPVLKSLNALGEQLLSGEQDDIELQYIFVLYPDGGRDEYAPYPHLSTGDYILMRQKPNKSLTETGEIERFNQLKWNKAFRYCPEKGRLFKYECPCEKIPEKTETLNCEYRDNTYLVIQINSGFSPLSLDVTQKYTEFQEEMEKAVDYTAMEEKLEAALVEFQESTSKSKNMAKIEELNSQAIHFVELACNSKNMIEGSHYTSELFDVVVGKRGMPTESQEFTDAQWSRLLFAMRKMAKDPFKVTQEAVQNAATAKDLANVLDCLPSGS